MCLEIMQYVDFNAAGSSNGFIVSRMSASASPSIPVLVTGALGRMGAEVIRAVQASPDCHLVGAIDTTPGKEGADVCELLGLGELEVALTADLEGRRHRAHKYIK